MTLADEVIADARARSGLTDFGDESFRDGLVALLEGAVACGTFNELGMAVLRDQVTGLLTSRLSIEDWYRRHPEIDEQQVVEPLIGLGMPRTGSTALSFLLAEDPRARSLLAWEAGAPTPPPAPATMDTDPRIAAAALQIELIGEMAPKFRSMLPTSPTGPTECVQLMALDFRTIMFDALGDNRAYDEWLATCDMTSAYRYHRRVLKLLQWRFPPRPWRLKAPAHMLSFGALTEVYPDARFVMTHRDIAQVIPSIVSLFDATSEHLRTGPLAHDFADYQIERWEQALRATLDHRDAGHADAFFDIGFSEMRPDPLPAVQRLYDWLGVELTDEVAGRMRTWWATNPADKQGIHDYTPEAYGIDVDDLRARFAFYTDRFDR